MTNLLRLPAADSSAGSRGDSQCRQDAGATFRPLRSPTIGRCARRAWC